MKQPVTFLLTQVLIGLLTLLGVVLFLHVSLPVTPPHLGVLAVLTGTFWGQSILARQLLSRAFSRPILRRLLGVGCVSWAVLVPLLSQVLGEATPGIIWLLLGLAATLYMSLAAVGVEGLRSALSQRYQQQQLEREKLALELSLVRSQLNPHFLFNVLNNIDHFVRQDPPKASQSIIQLSSLLRYLLYDTSQPHVPLAREVTFIEEYMTLQKQRLRVDTRCTFHQNLAQAGLDVVPAIFLPFLENAFRHCPLNQPDNFLYVELFTQPEMITFICRNSRQVAAPTTDSGGLGLRLARKRLALLYPAAHHLHILETAHHFSVELILTAPPPLIPAGVDS